MRQDMLRGHLDLLVLSVIERGAHHGYAIAEQLRLLSEGAFELREGTLYPALYRLEDAGMLRSDTTVVDGRRRRLYRLTQKGRRELAGRTREWHAFASSVAKVVEAQ